jgi:hypothetical protein
VVILVEATPEHFGIEQDGSVLYALGKCCGARLRFSQALKMYVCSGCSTRYSTFSAVRYPDKRWAEDRFYVQTYCDLDDDTVRDHANWWVGEWLEVEDLSSVNVVVV